MTSAYPPRFPGPNQYYNYRQQPQTSTGPPIDNMEHWYVGPSQNNRMILALESGIISEASWSLSRLIRISANEKPSLLGYSALPTALCQWPEWFLDNAQDDDAIMFSPNPLHNTYRQLALNSMMVLKNLAVSEDGATVLAKYPRVRTLVFSIMDKYPRPTGSALEFLLMAMEIFRLIVSRWPAAPSSEQIATLVSIIGQSSDKAILISGWTSLHTLLDTFPTAVHIKPDCEALNAAIRVLPLHLDGALTTAALDYILAHVSFPSLAKAFLHHPLMGGTLRLLVAQLLWDQKNVVDTSYTQIGVPPKTKIAQNNAIKLFDLSQAQLDEIGPLPEPQRATTWLQHLFEPSAQDEMTQIEFWTLYRTTFTPYGNETMLAAPDVIKLVSTVFPTAHSVITSAPGGKTSKFVIKGIGRRRATAEGRTKCHWDQWGCPEPPFATPIALYTHVKTHLAEASTTTCRWGSCTHNCATPEAFEAHLLTHLPLQFSAHRHPGQVDDVIIPSQPGVEDEIPIIRPVPPGPTQQIPYIKTREDPPSSSFAALLIMRILYRTSFVQEDVVTQTDSEHFGFPGIEQSTAEGEDGPATEDFGLSSLEGQRKGKAAFKAIGGMLSGVYIHDATIATWIDEMLDSIKALP